LYSKGPEKSQIQNLHQKEIAHVFFLLRLSLPSAHQHWHEVRRSAQNTVNINLWGVYIIGVIKFLIKVTKTPLFHGPINVADSFICVRNFHFPQTEFSSHFSHSHTLAHALARRLCKLLNTRRLHEENEGVQNIHHERTHSPHFGIIIKILKLFFSFFPRFSFFPDKQLNEKL
jgi:hypothetical protein